MIIPTTIATSRPRAILRMVGSLLTGLIGLSSYELHNAAGLPIAFIGGAFCIVTLGANLWVIWKPGAVSLKANGLQVNQPWTQVSLSWKDMVSATVCRAYRTGDLMMAPFNGFTWVEVQRRDGGPSVMLVGFQLGPQALADLIIGARSEWLARERAIFGEPDFAPTPLVPAKAGNQAESGPGQGEAG